MCEGARIAYDMARLLESQGEEVALLVMLDTWALEHSQIRPLWRLYYYSQRWKQFRRRPWEQQKREILAVLKTKFRRMRARRSSDAAAVGPKYTWTQTYWPENFVPPYYGGNITVLKRAKQPFYYVRDPLLGWGKRTSGAVETVVLHSPHGRILREPYVEEVGKLLLQSLAQLERQEAVKTASVSVPSPVVCCT
jgi:thioesterase domain-containing protein